MAATHRPAALEHGAYLDLMARRKLTDVDVAWICGVGLRHARAWRYGEYPIPQDAALVLQAFDEGRIDAAWLASKITAPPRL